MIFLILDEFLDESTNQLLRAKIFLEKKPWLVRVRECLYAVGISGTTAMAYNK
jgi:hypothetical protein